MAGSQNTPSAIKLTSWIFTLSAVILALQAFADALPKHALDASWLAHAKFHIVTGAAFQVGSSLLVILIARIPLLRLEAWSWYALLIYMLAFAVHIPAALWQGSGPPAWGWYLISILLILMAASLISTWQYCHRH